MIQEINFLLKESVKEVKPKCKKLNGTVLLPNCSISIEGSQNSCVEIP